MKYEGFNLTKHIDLHKIQTYVAIVRYNESRMYYSCH